MANKEQKPNRQSSQSTAAWLTPVDRETENRAEVHFNYWKIPNPGLFSLNKRTGESFAEVGVLLYTPEKTQNVKVFLPLQISNEDLEDCGPLFANTKIAQGIFNEALTAEDDRDKSPRRVKLLLNGKPFCVVNCFTRGGQNISNTEVLVESKSIGSLITIPRKVILNACRGAENWPVYFRLRFKDSLKRSAFVTKHTPPDWWLRPGYNEVEYMDFRLNEARTLPEDVEAEMYDDCAENPAKLERVAFLTAVPVLAELAVSSFQSHKNRPLEPEIWSDYIGGSLPEGMMVYHWKREPKENKPISDFTAFVKLQTRHSGTMVIIVYVIIAFILAVLSSFAASLI